MVYSVVASENRAKQKVLWQTMHIVFKFLQMRSNLDFCHSRMYLQKFWPTANQAVCKTFETMIMTFLSLTCGFGPEYIKPWFKTLQMHLDMPYQMSTNTFQVSLTPRSRFLESLKYVRTLLLWRSQDAKRT